MSDVLSPLMHSVRSASRLSSMHDNATESPVVSLESRVSHAIASTVVEHQQERNQIFAAMNDPNVTSHPEQLLAWQQRLTIYTLDTNLHSTLVRKGVAAIETLIKT